MKIARFSLNRLLYMLPIFRVTDKGKRSLYLEHIVSEMDFDFNKNNLIYEL